MKNYPRGKLRADDDGQVTMALAIQDGTLLIIYPHAVTWVGLGVADAEKLIAGLQAKVDEMKRGAA